MTKKNGFSLVELSIVLVILGLLVGGVLTGQSLIRAAELRSVTTEFQKYQAAVNTFRDKYFALPGDMTNAQSFWGVAHATPATCVTTVGTGTQTCNGNGDGIIVLSTGSNEQFRIWQHLANAGLIEGSYSGISGTGSTWDTDFTNSPRSKLSNVGYSFAGPFNILPADALRFEGNYGLTMQIGTKCGSWEYRCAFLRPEEAWNIDTKMDDGKPAYGIIRAFEGDANCTTTTTPSTSLYNLSDTNIRCGLNFVMN